MAKRTKIEKKDFLMNKDITKKLQSSFCILLLNYSEARQDDCWPSIYSPPQPVGEIRDFIAESVARLPDIMKYKGDELSAYIGRLIGYKKSILTMERVIHAYLSRLEYLSFINRIATYAEIFDEHPLETLDHARVISDCMAYIMQPGNIAKSNMRKAIMLSAFPVKMARERYLDYVRASVSAVFNAMGQSNGEDKVFINRYVSRLQFMFKPSANKEYGLFFPDVMADILEIKPGEADDSCDELNDKIDNISQELLTTHDFLTLLFEALNSILILSTFGADINYLFDGDVRFQAAYNTIAGNTQKIGEEPINATSIVSDRLDKFTDNLSQLSKRCNELQYDDELASQKDFAVMINVRNAITALFYEDMEDAAFNELHEVKDVDAAMDIQEYVRHCGDELANFIKCVLAEEPIDEQRLLKQIFLSHLFCPFSDNEFYEYIKDGFRTASSIKQESIIAINIAWILGKAGFEDLWQ